VVSAPSCCKASLGSSPGPGPHGDSSLLSPQATAGVVDRHHVDADPDPNFHFDADPGPDSNRISILMPIQIRILIGIRTMLSHMRILPQVLHVLQKSEFFPLTFTAVTVHIS
jgi:hypothetical protein